MKLRLDVAGYGDMQSEDTQQEKKGGALGALDIPAKSPSKECHLLPWNPIS